MRLMEGSVRPGQQVKMMASGAVYQVVECGHLLPLGMEPCERLSAGEVGYFTASIKNVKDTRVGDTVTDAASPPRRRPCRATGRSSPWSTAASTRRTAPSIRISGTRWKSSSSTTPP